MPLSVEIRYRYYPEQNERVEIYTDLDGPELVKEINAKLVKIIGTYLYATKQQGMIEDGQVIVFVE